MRVMRVDGNGKATTLPKEETLKQTDALQQKLGAASRSDVIRRAIGLSSALAHAVEKGDKIIIEGRGQRREILIPGLNSE